MPEEVTLILDDRSVEDKKITDLFDDKAEVSFIIKSKTGQQSYGQTSAAAGAKRVKEVAETIKNASQELATIASVQSHDAVLRKFIFRSVPTAEKTKIVNKSARIVRCLIVGGAGTAALVVGGAIGAAVTAAIAKSEKAENKAAIAKGNKAPADNTLGEMFDKLMNLPNDDFWNLVKQAFLTFKAGVIVQRMALLRVLEVDNDKRIPIKEVPKATTMGKYAFIKLVDFEKQSDFQAQSKRIANAAFSKQDKQLETLYDLVAKLTEADFSFPTPVNDGSLDDRYDLMTLRQIQLVTATIAVQKFSELGHKATTVSAGSSS